MPGGLCHFDIIEARRGIAVAVGDELHQQDAIGADEGPGNADAGICKPEQSIHFSSLPELFLDLTAIAAALFHGTLLVFLELCDLRGSLPPAGSCVA